MSCTTLLAGLGPPPNQTGDCFLLQHSPFHQFVLTKLQSEVLEFQFVTDGAPWRTLLPAIAPGQLQNSAALQLCQAEEGAPGA